MLEILINKLVYKYVRDNPDALCYYETGRTLKIGASPDYYTFSTIADMLNSQGIITDEINLVKDATRYAEGNTSAFKTQAGDPKLEGDMTYNATVMNEGVVQLKALYELYVEYILNDSDLKKSIATAQIIPGEEKSTLEQMLDDLQRKYEEIQKKYNTGPGRDCELIDAYIAELQEAIGSYTFSDGALTISFDYFADLYIRLLAKALCQRYPKANYDIIYTTIRTRLDTAIEMFVPASPSFN